mgnify:CR=1 FL=1
MRRVHKLQIVLATVMAAALLSGCEGSQETSTDVNPSAGKAEATPIQSPTSTSTAHGDTNAKTGEI